MPNSLLGYQSRSHLFRTFSRSSSGYFSFDNEPTSPLLTHNRSTQTPSPSCQVIIHALQRISEAQSKGRNYEPWPTLHNHIQLLGAVSAEDMQADSFIVQELRRIGDEFNHLYFETGRNGAAAQQPAENEPAFVLRVGLLIRHLLQFLLRRR